MGASDASRGTLHAADGKAIEAGGGLPRPRRTCERGGSMNRLYLLRHARAKWPAPGSRDFDRPLEPSGIADADALGRAMVKARYKPALVLCSSALRTRQTWEALSLHVSADSVLFLDGLYSSDSSNYVDIIREKGEEGCVMVIGHNPMMEDLAVALSHDGVPEALEGVAAGFPTCGLAVIRFPYALSSIKPEDGYLEAFVVPREL
jgi:phosphohistidine phosphatase